MGLDDLLTVTEAAKYLGVSRQWIYQRTRTGGLPVIRLGGQESGPIRFRRRELDEWIDSQRKDAAA